MASLDIDSISINAMIWRPARGVDTYVESKFLAAGCRRDEAIYITSLDSRRCRSRPSNRINSQAEYLFFKVDLLNLPIT